jgi:hypothetical protein
MVARLGVHVLGPRYGESIILELPDGGIGVIDSFAGQRSPHPVVEFLTTRFPRPSPLRFLAITHPHADHCYRAADLIDRLGVEEVWVFHPFPAGQLQHYYTTLARLGSRDAVEAALGLAAGSVALSLLQLNNRIRQPILKGTLRFRSFAGGQPRADFCGGRVHIHFLTPVIQSQYIYASAVENAATRLLDDGPALRESNRLPQPEHNRASGAILVRYGSTRLLLMADAEECLWEEWWSIHPPANLCKPVQFLKAAHHGSNNGYHGRLYTAMADPATTLAVITPFHQGSVRLPTNAGAEAIRPHVRELYCTNRASAASSSGLRWAPVTPPAIPRLPRSWATMIGHNPSLATLLVAETGVKVANGPIPAVPTEWLRDARGRPELWRLLRQEICLPTPTLRDMGAYLVSAYFNNQGTLLDLHVGDGAGRLVS